MGKKQKMDIEMADYEEEPDWETLAVLPMSKCSSKKYSTNIWDYFGQLMRGSVCVDNRNFYCLTCFEERKLKQYSASTATTNFFAHLRAIHGIILERNTLNRSKNQSSKTPKKDIKIIKQELICGSQVIDSDPTNDGLVTTNDDSFNELIVVKKRKTEETDYSQTVQQRPKSKKIFSKQDRSKMLNIYSSSSSPTVPLRIEESINSEDYDRLFILSLIKEFRRVSDTLRIDCKSEIIEVLRKFQRMSQAHSSIRPSESQHSYTITAMGNSKNSTDSLNDNGEVITGAEYVDEEYTT